ncbi:E3 ubiquitin-protein ligase MARCHF2 isoform X2 [Aethina tumida]|uniref:E3 ubiquitin-protein ligase MARCHF2 isoform X2 n=1 Tax=Aethina tumida TaxID=116153 RepID=UPI00096AE402|nr:E3 ubiquitin-protein ligase MARCHF2 isoform X2 [Aethina tumida]
MSHTNGCQNVKVKNTSRTLDRIEGILDKILPGTSNCSTPPHETQTLMLLLKAKGLIPYSKVGQTKNTISKNSSEPKMKTNSSMVKNMACTESEHVSKQQSNHEPSTDDICRICHELGNKSDLVRPCKCRGTMALVHLKCLVTWIRESNHSDCEVCHHHYKVIRQPKYTIFKSVFVFLKNSGNHLGDIIADLVNFSIFTPCIVASRHLLKMSCETLVANNIVIRGSLLANLLTASSIIGMAFMDFLYAFWLITQLQKHYRIWKKWYLSNQDVVVQL